MSTYLGTAFERANGESIQHLLQSLFHAEFDVMEVHDVTGHAWDLYDMPEDDEHLHLRVHKDMVLIRMHGDTFEDAWMDLSDTLPHRDHRLSCVYALNDTAMALVVEVFEAGRRAAMGSYESLTTGINGQGQDVLELDQMEGEQDTLMRLEDQMKQWFFPQGMPGDGWTEWVVRFRNPFHYDAENGDPTSISDAQLLRSAVVHALNQAGVSPFGEDVTLDAELVASQAQVRGLELPADLERRMQNLSMQPDSGLHNAAAQLEHGANLSLEDQAQLQLALALLRQRKPVMSFPVRISTFSSLPTNVSVTFGGDADTSSEDAPTVETPVDTAPETRSPYARPVAGAPASAPVTPPQPEAAPNEQAAPEPAPAAAPSELQGAALRKARRTKAKLLISEGRVLEARELDPEYDAMCFLRDEASKNVLHPLKQLREYPGIAVRLSEIEAGGQAIPELSLTVRRIRQLATPDLAGHLDTLRPQADARRTDGLLPFNDYLELSLIKTELHRRRKALDAKKVRDAQNAEFRRSGGGDSGMSGWDVVRVILIIIGLLLTIARLMR